MNQYLISFLFFFVLISCETNQNKTIALQPIGPNDPQALKTVSQGIEKYYGYKVYILEPITMPSSFFVRTNRFRADSAINFLREIKSDTITYIMGITSNDISVTTKDKDGNIKQPVERYKDWGVFGYGYMPGTSCIISTYRLSNKGKTKTLERITKVALHELGHNLGVPHCPNPSCFMRDANESIKSIDQEGLQLCKDCQQKIK